MAACWQKQIIYTDTAIFIASDDFENEIICCSFFKTVDSLVGLQFFVRLELLDLLGY